MDLVIKEMVADEAESEDVIETVERSPSSESKCLKCLTIFKTAGLLRRHQRLGCMTEIDGSNQVDPKTQNIVKKEESLIIERSGKEAPIATSFTFPGEIAKSKNKGHLFDSKCNGEESCSKAQGQISQGCRYLLIQGYLKPKPICMFRIEGCKNFAHCKFTHVIPEHLNLPFYCEPFLRGKCLESTKSWSNCYKLRHISFKDLNKMFFERLQRLRVNCDFCDIVKLF